MKTQAQAGSKVERIERSLPCYVISLALLASLCLSLDYYLLSTIDALTTNQSSLASLVNNNLQHFFIIMFILGFLVIATTGRFFWTWGSLVKEQKLTEKNREIDQLKTDFLTIASHQLRTPLTSLREGAALFLDDSVDNLTEIQHSLITIIDRNVRRLCNLVNDILDISMLEAGKTVFKKDKVEIRPLLCGAVDCIASKANEKNISVNILMEELPPGFGDPLRLNQVLMNLLANSIRHTPNGGRIDVSAQLRSHKSKNHIRFCVADSGTGISKEDQRHLFNKFHQISKLPMGNFQGTGLGLAICKEIVTSHDGEIWIESTLGTGTRVHFTIPQFSSEVWWKEVWNNLQIDGLDTGMSVLAVKIDSTDPQTLASFETRIRQSVKKQDRILSEPESGLIWVLACAKRQEGEQIANRLSAALQALVAENHLSRKVQFKISSDHIQNMVFDPMIVIGQLTERLHGVLHEQNPYHR